ncbi:DUF998 domain-containing protein [Micromonospora sp. 4G57]|uniref:DUF998 domain-containing protein n=1 Tax=Micromonospora sicca TaxID=2202420 RepID=A0ABU5JDU2_9ACTN|nr:MULTISPECIES: DUF998 domain-containing protein [unclassified Micromonospora]MDZ5445119.1 DUF998 domain-containing protein [Micromonospora sp. 4G57]MDZ5490762.1 DUF998 domain-containing protein [Micromonospora sp. 4G53]
MTSKSSAVSDNAEPLVAPPSLGTLGWIQMSAFIVAGLLSVAYAVGLRRVLRPGPAGTWGPSLFGVFGLGLIVGGLSFPPGAPEGNPDPMSWHGIGHAIAPPLAFTALVLACFVVVRRAVMMRQQGWAADSAAIGVVASCWWPGPARRGSAYDSPSRSPLPSPGPPRWRSACSCQPANRTNFGGVPVGGTCCRSGLQVPQLIGSVALSDSLKPEPGVLILPTRL